MPLFSVFQILIDMLLASELIDYRIRLGRPAVFCKLDLEKAYDHAN